MSKQNTNPINNQDREIKVCITAGVTAFCLTTAICIFVYTSEWMLAYVDNKLKDSLWRPNIIFLACSLCLFFPEVSPGSSNLIVKYPCYCPGFTFLRQKPIKFSLECTFQYNFFILAAMVNEPLEYHSWSRMSFSSLEGSHGLHVECHKPEFCNVNYINKIKSPLRHSFKQMNKCVIFIGFCSGANKY